MTVSNIRVRLPTKFPSSVAVTDPLTLSRTGGNYTFGLDATGLRDTFDTVYLPIADSDLTDLRLTTGASTGNASPMGMFADTENSSVIAMPANGFIWKANTSVGGSFASSINFDIVRVCYNLTATSGLFYNPSNLPIRSDNDRTIYAQNFGIVSDNQLVLNGSYSSLTPTVAAQRVTAVTVSPNLTGYTAGQVLGWTAYQSGAITAQGTVTATAGGVVNTAQFATATGLPTAAIFTSTPIILVQPPDMSGGKATVDVGPTLKIVRDMPNIYPDVNSYLGHIIFEGDTGTGATTGAAVEYGGIASIVEDPTTGSASGIIDFRRMRAGALKSVYLGGGFYVPSVTTDKGTGTANFAQVWDNGLRVVTQDGSGNVTVTGSLGAVSSIQASKTSAQPELSTFRSDAHGSAAPIGRLAFYGKDSAANVEAYAAIYGIVDDNTSTSEDASLHFYTDVAGTLAARMILTGADALKPATTDTLALGTSALMWSDLFLASGGVVNFNNGDVTITHATDKLTVAGGSLVFSGTSTNDSAAAGVVGEFISSSVETGSAVSLTTAVAANVTSISLTAGDWDLTGIVHLKGNAATTVTNAFVSVSTTSATLNNVAAGASQIWGNGNTLFSTATYVSPPSISSRISVSGTTTVYLVTQTAFAVNTCSAFGYIQARRVR